MGVGRLEVGGDRAAPLYEQLHCFVPQQVVGRGPFRVGEPQWRERRDCSPRRSTASRLVTMTVEPREAAASERGDIVGRVEHLLEVVQDEQDVVRAVGLGDLPDGPLPPLLS